MDHTLGSKNWSNPLHKQTHIKTQTDLSDTTHIRIPKQNFIKGFMSNYLNSQDYFKLKPAAGFFWCCIRCFSASWVFVFCLRCPRFILKLPPVDLYCRYASCKFLNFTTTYLSNFLAFSHCAPTAKKTTDTVWVGQSTFLGLWEGQKPLQEK